MKKAVIVFPQSSEDDVSQFDTKFTRQTPVDSPDDSALSDSVNQIFLVSIDGRNERSVSFHITGCPLHKENRGSGKNVKISKTQGKKVLAWARMMWGLSP